MSSSRNIWHKGTFVLALSFIIAGILLGQSDSAQAIVHEESPTPTGQQEEKDHSQLPALQGPFDMLQKVTRACLSRRAEAARYLPFHGTTHFYTEKPNRSPR
jgi:hypothetical protein